MRISDWSSDVCSSDLFKAQATTRDIPVIMLTARVEEEDKIRGLNIGCDDYVSKPFSYPELIARVKAVLRRVTPGGADEKLSASGIGRSSCRERGGQYG